MGKAEASAVPAFRLTTFPPGVEPDGDRRPTVPTTGIPADEPTALPQKDRAEDTSRLNDHRARAVFAIQLPLLTGWFDFLFLSPVT